MDRLNQGHCRGKEFIFKTKSFKMHLIITHDEKDIERNLDLTIQYSQSLCDESHDSLRRFL
jgi:hypothetical protein